MMTLSQFFDAVAKHTLGHREYLEMTYDAAMSCIARNIPGHFVECGVYQGGHCAAMARAIMDSYGEGELHSRQVHLFDSFEGMPAAEPRDQEIFQHHGAKTGESAASIELVKLNMQRWGIEERLLVYHKGWFQDTVPARASGFEADDHIALLRLDCDLYSSSKVCIDELYPLVAERGGYVIADDWNLSGFREAINTRVMPAPILWRLPTK